MPILLLCLALFFVIPTQPASAEGNTVNESFSRAKKMLNRDVYFDHRITFYCGAEYDAHNNITLPEGFTSGGHSKREGNVEWEHVVPAENFGRTFTEWREGSPLCTDGRGKRFKGRKCAEKVNHEYRLMQSDLYNLYPAIGSVNASRGNANFQMLPSASSRFGTCEMKLEDNKAEPPARARGAIARTYKYMSSAYPRYTMSTQQEQLMTAWDTMYPVDAWECTRAKRIEALQKNSNPFVKKPCQEQGLW